LAAKQRGPLAIYPWYFIPGYMWWYFKISHPYVRPLPEGDPLRSCEQEAIMEEATHMEGPLTTRLDSTLTSIQGLAEGLLASGERRTRLRGGR
jgi:hypothetical protein